METVRPPALFTSFLPHSPLASFLPPNSPPLPSLSPLRPEVSIVISSALIRLTSGTPIWERKRNRETWFRFESIDHGRPIARVKSEGGYARDRWPDLSLAGECETGICLDNIYFTRAASSSSSSSSSPVVNRTQPNRTNNKCRANLSNALPHRSRQQPRERERKAGKGCARFRLRAKVHSARISARGREPTGYIRVHRRRRRRRGRGRRGNMRLYLFISFRSGAAADSAYRFRPTCTPVSSSEWADERIRRDSCAHVSARMINREGDVRDANAFMSADRHRLMTSVGRVGETA